MNLCIFQVDLFSSEGLLPRTLLEAAEREKEIRFSSRTRMSTTAAMTEQKLRKAAMTLLKKLPAKMQNDPDVKILKDSAREAGITVMHLIKRATGTDSQSKDYEFSRLSMDEHWKEGLEKVKKSFASKAWKNRKIPDMGMITFDGEKVVGNGHS